MTEEIRDIIEDTKAHGPIIYDGEQEDWLW